MTAAVEEAATGVLLVGSGDAVGRDDCFVFLTLLEEKKSDTKLSQNEEESKLLKEGNVLRKSH